MRNTSKKIKTLFIVVIILIVSLNLVNSIYNRDRGNKEKTNLLNPDLSYWDPVITRYVGETPFSHFIGDANNDGYNDIVTGNEVDETVSILLWNEISRDWDPQIEKPVASTPASVFIGDADNDGHNDIITANPYVNNISILLWKGVSGDWNSQITRSVGNYPMDVFIGDANNDGYNDIVTVNTDGFTVSILLWNETSSNWDPQIKKIVGINPSSLFIGDADNDGYDDIVATNAGGNTVSILLWNETSSNWDPQIKKSVGLSPWAVFIRDANNDGYDDIVATHLGENNVSILLWNETSSNWDPQIKKSVGLSPWAVFIGDADNDGHNDIVTANLGENTISILLWNEISGDWDSQITESVSYTPTSVFIEDANNDGYNDITATCYDNFSVSILLWRSLSPVQIISPENKTYVTLPDGYYFATYGFENDINGRNPGWFQEVGTKGGTAKVIEELGGHKKVLELHDTSSGFVNAHVIKNLFATPEFGSVEYWLRSDNPKLCGFRLDNGAIVNELVTMRIAFNTLQYNNGSDWNDVRFIENNIWYHIRVDFECSTGNYTGLAQYTWRLYVNGINYGEFNFINNQNQASRIEWYTDYVFGLQGYSYYIDAIGFSWTSNYNPGDNLNEGLLLQFDPKLQFNTISYSFDGQAEIKILGNTVIPFPEDGLHTIQIFGSDLAGDTTQSELRYFTVDTKFPDIQINSPGLNDIFGTVPPKFDISITEENIVTTWYTLDGGITNISFTELTGYIDLETWLSLGNGPITIRFYVEDIVGNIDYDEITIFKQRLISIEIIDQSFLKEEFNITFYVHNETGEEIDFAIIQIWWDGIDVSTDIQNLGSGLYFISLDPITVAYGDDPILLNMTISAIRYEEKYFETYLAIDPVTLQKGEGGFSEELILSLIITFSVISAGAIIGAISIYWLRRRNR